MSGPTQIPPDISPSRYVEKVSLGTGEVLDQEIQPRQLLVHHHRDYHIVDIHAHYMMGRVVKATGDENWAYEKMKRMRRLGHRTAEVLAKAIGQKDPEKISKALFGLKKREYFFRYKRHPHTKEEIEATISELKQEAEERMAAATVGGKRAVRVLLTGGTGFVGKEFLWQAAHDEEIAEVVVLIRPKEIRDRESGEIVKVISPQERGADLLRQLWLDGSPAAARFRFIAGDVEEPHLGVDEEERERLARTLTHVIHCAASVAFDDPYDVSFRANVTGTLNALRFSLALQETDGSPFVAHVSIETSYIHGRHIRAPAREDEIVFPRKFYNNYYELTKAMASIETERFMLDKGLRVAQLCPAIVIGEERAGNNRGDTKVVNAPINLFGRASDAKGTGDSRFENSKISALARLACIFPADPSAQINLITVDRVAEGMVAALKRPQAVGERVHLASDKRITPTQIRDIVEEEVGAKVTLAEPTLHRTVTLPLLTGVLRRVKQPKVAYAMEKLGTIFAGYSEWGQPVHEVGNDVRVLGLSDQRPSSEQAFRMLCRHNRYVQGYGKVKDLDEISRREKTWWNFILELERESGAPVGAMPAADFRAALEERFDLERFERKRETTVAVGADAVRIREERDGDAAAIREVLVAAFETEAEANLVESLREGTGLFLSLVAELDGRPIGHVLFTEVEVERAPGKLALGLAPMAVHPEYQRRRIGSRLAKAGLEACRGAQAALVVVLGHPDYYPRFGFERADLSGLVYEDPVPPEAFMALALDVEAAGAFSGRVRYRPEFRAASPAAGDSAG